MRHDVHDRTRWTRCWIALAALGCLAIPARAASPEEQAHDGYEAGDYARVRYEENGVVIQRTPTEDRPLLEEPGDHNAPLFPGDSILTGPDQKAEVQLAGGTLVRIDRGTDVTFLALPDPYAEFPDNTVLQLAGGVVRLAAVLDSDEELRVDTPASSIYVIGDADLRIEVDSQGRTRVFSRRGVTEVVGNGGSVLLRGGTQTAVYRGSTPEQPYAFNTFVADAFDRWVEDREAAYRVQDRLASNVYQDLPREVRPYYTELAVYGSWVRSDPYGWVWVPTAARGDWRPYRDGYWSYGPHGYFWVANEPWGWAPYHYGRWEWVGNHGWCWIPGRVFAGAWVTWSWGSAHVGWAPLGYWNRPVYVTNVLYDYYCPRSWTFVSYTHVHRHNVVRYAVPVHDVGTELQRAAVGTRPPRVSPRDLARSEESRSAAVRQVRGDVTHRALPARAERGSSFADVERIGRDDRVARSRSEHDRAAASARIDEPAPGRRAGTTRSSQPDRSADRTPDRDRGEAGRASSAASFPRRLTGTRPDAKDGNAAGREGAGRPDTVRTAEPRTTDRLRNLYREMGRTPRTRESGGEPAPDSGTRREPSRAPGTTPDRSAADRSGSQPGTAAPAPARPREDPAPRSQPAAAPRKGDARPSESRPARDSQSSGRSKSSGSRKNDDHSPAPSPAAAPAPSPRTEARPSADRRTPAARTPAPTSRPTRATPSSERASRPPTTTAPPTRSAARPSAQPRSGARSAPPQGARSSSGSRGNRSSRSSSAKKQRGGG